MIRHSKLLAFLTSRVAEGKFQSGRIATAPSMPVAVCLLGEMPRRLSGIHQYMLVRVQHEWGGEEWLRGEDV